jgi:hypothetical protein
MMELKIKAASNESTSIVAASVDNTFNNLPIIDDRFIFLVDNTQIWDLRACFEYNKLPKLIEIRYSGVELE